MVNNTECGIKHKNINWVIGVIFMIIFSCITAFLSITGYCLAGQTTLAKDVAEYRVKVEILESMNSAEHKIIFRKLEEISVKLDVITEKLSNIDKRLSILEKEHMK